MRSLCLSLLIAGALGLGVPGVVHAQPAGDAGFVDIVGAQGLLDVPLSRYVESRVTQAQADDVEVLVLQLDVPAALEVDVTELADRIEAAGPPTVTWIAPRGAALGSDVIELAGATDAVFVSSQVDIQAVAGTFEAETASSLQELLAALDGRTLDGRTLETWDETRNLPTGTVRFQQMGVWDRLLHAVTSPEVALLLLLAGLFGFVFEIYNPGIGLAAIIGAGSLALSIYAFSALPTRWLAVPVIVAGTLLLVADVHLVGFGALSLSGLVAVVAGSIFLVPSDVAALSLSPWAIAAAAIGTGVFFVSVMTAALRVRLRRPVSDEDRLVGAIGEAKTDIAPEGTVVTKGTVWRARTMETGIAAGAKVKIMATEGVVLLVEPFHDD